MEVLHSYRSGFYFSPNGLGALLLLLCAATLWAQAGANRDSMVLHTGAFPAGGDIPEKYTCKGANVSPYLAWSGAPVGTKSLALIMDDPDAPSGTFTHWVLYAPRADIMELPEGLPTFGHLANGVIQGKNGFGKIGYGGPCPPPGKDHRYFFKLFALDVPLKFEPGSSRADLESAMTSHVIGQAELMGKFRR